MSCSAFPPPSPAFLECLWLFLFFVCLFLVPFSFSFSQNNANLLHLSSSSLVVNVFISSTVFDIYQILLGIYVQLLLSFFSPHTIVVRTASVGMYYTVC